MKNEKPKAYIVRMSAKGMDIQIDEDEVQRVLNGIITGSPIKVRRGIINPSFYVGIVEDHDRISSFIREINQIKSENEQNEKYGFNGGTKKSLPEFKKLSDIFDGLKLTAGNQNKMLN